MSNANKTPARPRTEYRIAVAAHVYISITSDRPLSDEEAKAAAVARLEQVQDLNGEHFNNLASAFKPNEHVVAYLARDANGAVDVAAASVEDVCEADSAEVDED